MNSSQNPNTKLNLFALPSQTGLLFFTILTVLGVPILLSGGPNSFLLLPVLPVALGLLVLWGFLRQPDLIRERWRLEAPAEDQSWLVEWIRTLAAAVDTAPVPLPLIAGRDLGEPFTFGTWRRHYLALPGWLVDEMAKVRPPDRAPAYINAVLRHELTHFANRDVWLLYLSRSFLKMTVLFLATTWFALLWTPFLYQLLRPFFAEVLAMVPSFLSGLLPPEVQARLADPPELTFDDAVVYVGMLSLALAPLAGGGLVLWLHTWHLLLRVREFYSDARAVAWHGGDMAAFKAAGGQLGLLRMSAQAAADQERTGPLFWRRLWQWIEDRRSEIGDRIALPGRPAWLSTHPTPQERIEALNRPEIVYGCVRQIGLRAGFVVLLLYLALASLFTPMAKGVNSEIAVGFGFVVLAVGLTPRMLARLPDTQEIRRELGRAVGYYVLVFNTAMALLLAQFIALAIIQPRNLDLTFYVIAMVAPGSNVAPVLDNPAAYLWQVAVGSFVTFFVGLPLLMFAFLAADMALKRRVLTWYSTPLLSRHSKSVLLGITAVLALILWFGALPLLNVVAFPSIFAVNLQWGLQVGLAWLLAVLAGLGFLYAHRRHAGHCPLCDTEVTGPFFLGKRCCTCNSLLNRWLIAPY